MKTLISLNELNSHPTMSFVAAVFICALYCIYTRHTSQFERFNENN